MSMQLGGQTRLAGTVTHQLHRRSQVELPVRWRWRLRNLPHLAWGTLLLWIALLAHRLTGVPVIYGTLSISVTQDGRTVDLGVVSRRVVTTAGVTKIVDFLRASDTSTGTTFKYHGYGTGSTAEASGDTALVTELTTEYATDSTRPTGTQTNNGATVYRSVGTLAVDSGTPALREHGLFSASSSGTLLDRSVYSAINVDSTTTLTTTYDLTVAAGG